MQLWRLALGVGCGLLAQVATAGTGWVGGGGELTGDALNPWFIQNTPVVKACIEIDREHVHLAAEIADLEVDVVRPVLAYWQDQIKHADVVDYGGPTVFSAFKNYPVIGTQTYRFGPCSDDTDLRFEFGTLSSSQRQGFAAQRLDPRRFVSLAVRTDYDPVNLRGRGFIYVAADSGDLKPLGEGLAEQPWTIAKGQLLRNVLAHEFGHVLGLRHSNDDSIGSNSTNDLMSAYYPEMIVRKDKAHWAAATPDYFRTDRARIRGFCTGGGPLSPATTQFLGLDAASSCFEARFSGPNAIDILSDPASDKGVFTKVGTITIEPSQVNVNYRNLLRLWLPPQQTVIGVPSWYKEAEVLVLPARAGAQRIGTYRDVHGRVQREVIINQTGVGFSLTAIGDKKALMAIP